MALNASQRSTRASIAAEVMHARNDPKKITAPARAGFEARFEREADPDGVLDPAERARRARHLMAAHMKRLALASSKARATRSRR